MNKQILRRVKLKWNMQIKFKTKKKSLQTRVWVWPLYLTAKVKSLLRHCYFIENELYYKCFSMLITTLKINIKNTVNLKFELMSFQQLISLYIKDCSRQIYLHYKQEFSCSTITALKMKMKLQWNKILNWRSFNSS